MSNNNGIKNQVGVIISIITIVGFFFSIKTDIAVINEKMTTFEDVVIELKEKNEKLGGKNEEQDKLMANINTKFEILLTKFNGK